MQGVMFVIVLLLRRLEVTEVNYVSNLCHLPHSCEWAGRVLGRLEVLALALYDNSHISAAASLVCRVGDKL